MRTRKFYLIPASIMALILIIGSWSAHQEIKKNSHAETTHSLTAVRDTIHQAVRTWFMDHKGTAISWANSPIIRKSAQELLSLPPQQDPLLNVLVQQMLRDWFQPLAQTARYRGFFLVGPNNINLASSRDQNLAIENLLVAQQNFLNRVWAGNAAVSLPIESDVPLFDDSGKLEPNLSSIFVAAPVRNGENKVIAIFMFRLDPAQGFTKILNQGRLGPTGESYAFDFRGRLISESRFNAQLYQAKLLDEGARSILNLQLRDPGVNLNHGDVSALARDKQPLTFMAKSAIQGQTGSDITGHRDYRGVPVVSAWVWDDELNLGIATELDAAEAFATLRATQWTIISLSLFGIFLLFGFSIIYSFYKQRHFAEIKARKERDKAKLYLDMVETILVALDKDGNITLINRKGCELFDYQEKQLIGRNWFDICLPKSQKDELFTQFKLHIGGEKNELPYYENEVLTRSGVTRLIAWHNTFFNNGNGGDSVSLSAGEDITEQKKAELELQRAATVFDNTDEAIIVTDADAKILMVNKAFTDITGYQAEEVLGTNPRFLQSGRHDSAFYQNMWNILNKDCQWRGEIWNQRKNGDAYPAWENINIVKNNQGIVTNYVAIFSDISILKATEERMAHIAHHDALTGLPNRLRFFANLEQAIKAAQRHQHKLALLFMDLDKFKQINDNLGHDAGDELLKTVAHRLETCVREEDTVARLGGDEFTVILTELAHSEDAELIAKKMINAISEPVFVGNERIDTSASIGISLFPDDAKNSKALIKAADTAMYHAKAQGKNTCQLYASELYAQTIKQAEIENSLRGAVERGEFELFYQPQISLLNGKMSGVEALIRWNQPQRGLILPEEFIYIADECNLIDPISEWVLQTLLADNSKWARPDTNGPRISINITLRQITAARSLQHIFNVIEALDIAPNILQLNLEITETALESFDHTVEIINRLKQNGVMFAIDDFGTGHSPLSRLKQLPVDTVKIGRGFVNGLVDNDDDRAIVTAIIAVAHSLSLRVIGEGVETKQQLDVLRQLGCDEIQGFYFSQPVPAEQISQLLDKVFLEL